MGTSAPTQKLSPVGRGRCLIGPPSMAGQTAWYKPGGPGGSGKPKHLPRQGPVARKERWRPLKFCPPEGSSSRRGRKNGVLVPLPPWAKEPAAGAAELSPLCSFQGWKEPKIPGGWLRGVPALQSPAPGPPLRRTLPGSRSANPARVVQLIVPASAPLPLAGQLKKSRLRWTVKARRLPPAVGAGP